MKGFKNFLLEQEFPSAIDMGARVRFIPSAKDRDFYKIKGEHLGVVVGVRFTPAKVFYDCLCDYYSIVFRDVDSVNVVDGKIGN